MNNLGRDRAEQLEQLMAEDVEGALSREAKAFDDVAAFPNALVLFGAGNLGRRTLSGLRGLGIEPRGFVDSNKARWGQEVDGLPVFSPEQAAERFGDRATFVVTIWGALGNDRMETRIAWLRQLGCKSVVSFVPLYWKYPEIFLPHYTIDLPHHVHAQKARIREALGLFAEERSSQEFLAQLRFRLLGDFSCLPDPVPGAIYFQDDLFRLGKNEAFIDCGAFDGDSLDLFLETVQNSFESVNAFEPDPVNYAKLQAKVSSLSPEVREKITLHGHATGEVHSRVVIDAGSGPSSQIGKGQFEVECVTLGSALSGVPVSMIKMDIEGSELATLTGAKNLIQERAPILAISAYHRQADLWNIPLLIHELNPDYLFYLRPHMLEAWDLVCYAVPTKRRR